MNLLLSCTSGLADLSLAAGLAYFAHDHSVEEVPALLGLDASLGYVVETPFRDPQARLQMEVAEQGQRTYPQLQDALLAAAKSHPDVVSPEVLDDALRALYLRQTIQARTLRTEVGARPFSGRETAQILIELLTSCILYHRLDSPSILTIGSVVVGGMSPPEVWQLLSALPLTTGPTHLELTSTTSAALLASWHTRHLTPFDASRLSFEDTVLIPTAASEDFHLQPSELSRVTTF